MNWHSLLPLLLFYTVASPSYRYFGERVPQNVVLEFTNKTLGTLKLASFVNSRIATHVRVSKVTGTIDVLTSSTGAVLLNFQDGEILSCSSLTQKRFPGSRKVKEIYLFEAKDETTLISTVDTVKFLLEVGVNDIQDFQRLLRELCVNVDIVAYGMSKLSGLPTDEFDKYYQELIQAAQFPDDFSRHQGLASSITATPPSDGIGKKRVRSHGTETPKAKNPAISFQPNMCAMNLNPDDIAPKLVEYYDAEEQAYALYMPQSISRLYLTANELRPCSDSERTLLQRQMFTNPQHRFRTNDVVEVNMGTGPPNRFKVFKIYDNGTVQVKNEQERVIDMKIDRLIMKKWALGSVGIA